MNKHIEDCAKILFERHNPDTDIDSDVGQRLMDGFVRDLECISHYYNITRKDKVSSVDKVLYQSGLTTDEANEMIGKVVQSNTNDWQSTLSKQIDRLGMLPETRMINTVIEDLKNLYDSLSEKEYTEKSAQILNPVNQWYSELLTAKNKEIELLKEHIREWIKLIESASIYL